MIAGAIITNTTVGAWPSATSSRSASPRTTSPGSMNCGESGTSTSPPGRDTSCSLPSSTTSRKLPPQARLLAPRERAGSPARLRRSAAGIRPSCQAGLGERPSKAPRWAKPMLQSPAAKSLSRIARGEAGQRPCCKLSSTRTTACWRALPPAREKTAGRAERPTRILQINPGWVGDDWPPGRAS